MLAGDKRPAARAVMRLPDITSAVLVTPQVMQCSFPGRPQPVAKYTVGASSRHTNLCSHTQRMRHVLLALFLCSLVTTMCVLRGQNNVINKIILSFILK